jgi:hypothetical protein
MMGKGTGIIWFITLVSFAVGIHGLITESGPVGWLMYAQQSVLGFYSMKLTALLTFLLIGAVTLCASAIVARVLGNREGMAAAGSASRQFFLHGVDRQAGGTLTGKTLFCLAIAMVAVTWIIGFAVYTWNTAKQQGDATASYEPIALRSGAAAPAPKGTHVAIEGELLTASVLTHTSGRTSSSRDDYHLLPVVPPGWRTGQPVSYIAKVVQLTDLPGRAPAWPRKPPHPADGLLLGRVSDAIPVAAAQKFKSMGIVLTEPAYLVTMVRSEQGRPAVKDTSKDDFMFFIVACTGISAVICFCFFVMWFSALLRERRKARTLAAIR